MPPGVDAAVTFGFTELTGDGTAEDDGTVEDYLPSTARASERNAGLGTGPGGQLARSYLGATAVTVLDPYARRQGHHSQTRGNANAAEKRAETVLEAQTGTPRTVQSLNDGGEPQGMFLGLLLNDTGPVADMELSIVRSHRWTFKGADDLAKQGKSFYFFLRCLLDLQRNVQVDDQADVLDPKLGRACRGFVSGLCREGRMGDMYQLLTHFLSNSLIFHEWHNFLKNAFEDQRKSQETFLVPLLEQVWSRYCKFRAAVESIFGVLDDRFAWRHRLPKVGDLVQEHMKRRCIYQEHVLRNELFVAATVRNETIKRVKLTFGIN